MKKLVVGAVQIAFWSTILMVAGVGMAVVFYALYNPA